MNEAIEEILPRDIVLREVASVIRTAAKLQTIFGVQIVFGYELTMDGADSLVKRLLFK